MPKFSKKHTNKVQNIIANFLTDTQYTHYLTIHLPYTANSLIKAQFTLKKIAISFEHQLLGRWWFKHHVPFVAIAERHKNQKYHYHLLLSAPQNTTKQLKTAIDNIRCDKKRLPTYTFDLKEIDHTPDRLSSYCVKQLKSDTKFRFDTDRITYSHILFDLPAK